MRPPVLSYVGPCLLAVSALAGSPHARAATLDDGGVLVGLLVAGQTDRHEFVADAGDALFLNVAELGNTSFFPTLALFDPAGNKIAETGGQGAASVDGLELPASGRYRVVVQDSGADTPGDYALWLATVPGARAPTLAPDAEVFGELGPGELRVHTIDASPGDTLHVTFAEIGNTSFFPVLSLFDPTGTELVTASGQGAADSGAVRVATGGPHTIVARDSGADTVGEFALRVTKSPGGAKFGSLGEDAGMSFDVPPGELATWRVPAALGDVLHANLGELGNTSFFPVLELYGPDGEQVARAAGQGGASIFGYAVTESGTHTLVGRDSGADTAGRARFGFARAPGAAALGTLVDGDVVERELEPGGLDSFRFAAASGASVFLTVAEVGNTSFFPTFRVYDPAGRLVGSASGQVTASAELVARIASQAATTLVSIVLVPLAVPPILRARG